MFDNSKIKIGSEVTFQNWSGEKRTGRVTRFIDGGSYEVQTKFATVMVDPDEIVGVEKYAEGGKIDVSQIKVGSEIVFVAGMSDAQREGVVASIISPGMYEVSSGFGKVLVDSDEIVSVKKYGYGGSIEEQNYEMVKNNNKAIAHHSKELDSVLVKNKKVPAWVVAKVYEASNDLSDVTHYLDGTKFKQGGSIESLLNRRKKLLEELLNSDIIDEEHGYYDDVKSAIKSNDSEQMREVIDELLSSKLIYKDDWDYKLARKLSKENTKKFAYGGTLSEYGGTNYLSWDFDNKGNKWNVLVAWGRNNYISILKKTNNPYGGRMGTEFKSVDEALAKYKDPTIQANILFAIKEAEKHGKPKQWKQGGYVRPSSSLKTTGIYEFRTNYGLVYEFSVVGFERKGDDTDSLYFDDLDTTAKKELGSITIKNNAWNRLSKGQTITAESAKGTKGKLTRLRNLYAEGGTTDFGNVLKKKQHNLKSFLKNQPVSASFDNYMEFDGENTISINYLLKDESKVENILNEWVKSIKWKYPVTIYKSVDDFSDYEDGNGWTYIIEESVGSKYAEGGTTNDLKVVKVGSLYKIKSASYTEKTGNKYYQKLSKNNKNIDLTFATKKEAQDFASKKPTFGEGGNVDSVNWIKNGDDYLHPSGYSVVLEIKKGDEDWSGETYEEDMYIITDENGMDAVGSYMPLDEAKQTLVNILAMDDDDEFKKGGSVGQDKYTVVINYSQSKPYKSWRKFYKDIRANSEKEAKEIALTEWKKIKASANKEIQSVEAVNMTELMERGKFAEGGYIKGDEINPNEYVLINATSDVGDITYVVKKSELEKIPELKTLEQQAKAFIDVIDDRDDKYFNVYFKELIEDSEQVKEYVSGSNHSAYYINPIKNWDEEDSSTAESSAQYYGFTISNKPKMAQGGSIPELKIGDRVWGYFYYNHGYGYDLVESPAVGDPEDGTIIDILQIDGKKKYKIKFENGEIETLSESMIKDYIHFHKKFAQGGGVQYKDLSQQKDMVINESKNKFSEKKNDVPEVEMVFKKAQEFESYPVIDSSDRAIEVFRKFWDQERIPIQESFYVMFLNTANKPISIYNPFKGGISSTVADVEIITAAAIKSLARGVIICHNHPSGQLKFSQADINLTRNLSNALKIVTITLLDSMVITENSYISMADERIDFTPTV